jgi:hypothetical protein
MRANSARQLTEKGKGIEGLDGEGSFLTSVVL